MTEELKTITAELRRTGLPCLRTDALTEETGVPALTWSYSLLSNQEAELRLSLWYPENDEGLPEMIDTLQGMFPDRGRSLRTDQGRLMWLAPKELKWISDEKKNHLCGARLILRVQLFPREEVRA